MNKDAHEIINRCAWVLWFGAKICILGYGAIYGIRYALSIGMLMLFGTIAWYFRGKRGGKIGAEWTTEKQPATCASPCESN